MVDGEEVLAVLTGVRKAAAGDLRELTRALEARQDERICWRGIDVPKALSRPIIRRV